MIKKVIFHLKEIKNITYSCFKSSGFLCFFIYISKVNVLLIKLFCSDILANTSSLGGFIYLYDIRKPSITNGLYIERTPLITYNLNLTYDNVRCSIWLLFPHLDLKACFCDIVAALPTLKSSAHLTTVSSRSSSKYVASLFRCLRNSENISRKPLQNAMA